MEHDTFRHHRRSIRLKGYDYSQDGAYFVTVCARDRGCVFGVIVDGEIRLNDAGRIVDDEWRVSAALRAEIELDLWIVMPNHVHGVVFIVGAYGHTPLRNARTICPYETPLRTIETPLESVPKMVSSRAEMSVGAYGHTPLRSVGTPLRSPSKTVGAMIRGFKSAATRRINELHQTPGVPVWQRNYYERIVRSDEELDRIRLYVSGNPACWEHDQENPFAIVPVSSAPR